MIGGLSRAEAGLLFASHSERVVFLLERSEEDMKFLTVKEYGLAFVCTSLPLFENHPHCQTHHPCPSVVIAK